MEPYIEFIGTLQQGGFWLVKVYVVPRHFSNKQAELVLEKAHGTEMKVRRSYDTANYEPPF